MVTARMPHAPKSQKRYWAEFCANTPTFSCTFTPRLSMAFDTFHTMSENSFHEHDFHSEPPKSL